MFDMNEPDLGKTRGNVMPQNLDAETAVLAAGMLSPDVLGDLTAMLSPEDFYLPQHRVVFQALKDMLALNTPVDQLSLADHLRRSGELNTIGGEPFIISLAGNSFALANWETHAKIIKRCAIQRALIAASANVTALAFNPPAEDIESIVEKAEATLLSVTSHEISNASKSLKDLVSNAFDEIRAAANNEGHIVGVETGFVKLDKILLGLRPGSLTIIGARPGVGKTSFALSLALNAARKGVPIIFFSLEMSGVEITTRLLCAEAQINSEEVRSGRIKNESWTPIISACETLSNLRFVIDDTAGTNVVEIRTKARRILQDFAKEMQQEHPQALIIVDYLQLITPADSRQTDRNLQVGEMSRALKVLAKDLRVPVIALSQLNRDLERRPDKRPMLADLRDSGSIEQDADAVIFLDRSLSEEEAKDTKHNRPPAGTARVIVAKNRAGRSGEDLLLTFLSDRTQFMNHTGAAG